VYLSADGYEVVRHGVVDRRGAAARRSGITSLLMLGSKLSAVVGPTDHVTLSGVIDVAGPQGTAEVLRALFVSYTGQARRFEPIFSLRLLKSLLEAKVPCVNEDRAKGLDFVRRRLEAIVRSQADRLLRRLGTTLDKVLAGEGDDLAELYTAKDLDEVDEEDEMASNAKLLLYWCVATGLEPVDFELIQLRAELSQSEWLRYALPTSLKALRRFFGGGLAALFDEGSRPPRRPPRRRRPE
jgi:hypothetical protein